MLFRYFAFSLEIDSEIRLPELLPVDSVNPAQVIVKLADVPEILPDSIFKGVRFQGNNSSFLLKVDNVARYLIEGGNTISIQPYNNAIEKDIRLFLLGSAMGALIHQRGMLPFHGSSVIINNKVVIFSGSSGVGKSTLAAAFVKKGFPIITDDVCVITLDRNGQPVVHPGYPQMKLWSDSLEKIGHSSHLLEHVREGIKKYNFPVSSSFHNIPEILNGIYFISSKNTEGFKIEILKGIDKFNCIKNNTYRLNFIKGTGTTSSHFSHIEAISRLCFVRKIERPSKGFHLSDLVSLIENDIDHGA